MGDEAAVGIVSNPLFLLITFIMIAVIVAIIGIVIVLIKKSSKGQSINICPKCGKPIKNEKNFCTNCGAKIE